MRPFLSLALLLWLATAAAAEPPSTAYIFPAGGQRGTKVTARVGGHFLHDKCRFEILGPGVVAPNEIQRVDTIWFEGPLIHQPASQQKEDYPKDYGAELTIAPDAPLGDRFWRVWNAQGAVPARRFVIGDLPEVVEHEIDGEPIPVPVSLPVTINGRTFPREDVDVWSFEARAGQVISCAVAAASIGSPLEAHLEVRDSAEQNIAQVTGSSTEDSAVHFPIPSDGTYHVRISDVRSDGLQHFVYRLTITEGLSVNFVYPLGGRRGTDVKLMLNGRSGTLEPAKENIEEARRETIVSIPPEAPAIWTTRCDLGSRLNHVVRLAVDDLPEHLEAEPNDSIDLTRVIEAPAVVNGRIDRPGDHDLWTFTAKKGEALVFELQAARLGSYLSAVVIVRDDAGKELARVDALSNGGNDPQLAWAAPADGKFAVEVQERFASRGGWGFGYRLRIAPPLPRLRIELASDAISVDRGKEQKFPVNVIREGGFHAPVTLALEGLPAGVTAPEVSVAANQNKGEFALKADATASITASRVRVIGKFTAEKGDQYSVRTPGVAALSARGPEGSTSTESVIVPAVMPQRFGEPSLDSVLLAVTLPTPFKFQGQYQMTFLPCGSVIRKRYTLDRGGYDGPLEIALADKQARHVQGVTAPMVAVPAGADEFIYPITLPPWMELGRTCRVVIMATGEVDDGQGHKHKVCYTTVDQNNQMVNLISPPPLKLQLERTSLAASSDSQVQLTVRVKRDRSVTSPVRVELIVPQHMRGITAEPLEIPTDQAEGQLTLKFGASPGPLNMPVIIRATGHRQNDPVTAESPLEIVKVPGSGVDSAKNRPN